MVSTQERWDQKEINFLSEKEPRLLRPAQLSSRHAGASEHGLSAAGQARRWGAESAESAGAHFHAGPGESVLDWPGGRLRGECYFAR